MVGPHDITKGNLGTHEPSIGSCGERAATTSLFLRDTRFPVSHVITDRPLALIISEPGILALLIQGCQISLPLEINMLQPEGRRPAPEVCDGHLVAPALLKSNRSDHCILADLSPVNLPALERHHCMRAFAETSMNLMHSTHRNVDEGGSHHGVRAFDGGQPGIYATQGDRGFHLRFDSSIISGGIVGSPVDRSPCPDRRILARGLVDPMPE